MANPAADLIVRLLPVDLSGSPQTFRGKVLTAPRRASQAFEMQVIHSYRPSSGEHVSWTPPPAAPPKGGRCGEPLLPPIPDAERPPDSARERRRDAADGTLGRGAATQPPSPRPPSARTLKDQRFATLYKPWHFRSCGLPGSAPLESTHSMPQPRRAEPEEEEPEDLDGSLAHGVPVSAATSDLLTAIARQREFAPARPAAGARARAGLGAGGPEGRARAVLGPAAAARAAAAAASAAAAAAEAAAEHERRHVELRQAYAVLATAQDAQTALERELRLERLRLKREAAAVTIQARVRGRRDRIRVRTLRHKLSQPDLEEQERLWHELRKPRAVRTVAGLASQLKQATEAAKARAAARAAPEKADALSDDPMNGIRVEMAIEGIDVEMMQVTGGPALEACQNAISAAVLREVPREFALRAGDVNLLVPWDSRQPFSLEVVPPQHVDLNQLCDSFIRAGAVEKALVNCLSSLDLTDAQALYECVVGDLAVEILAVTVVEIPSAVRPVRQLLSQPTATMHDVITMASSFSQHVAQDDDDEEAECRHEELLTAEETQWAADCTYQVPRCGTADTGFPSEALSRTLSPVLGQTPDMYLEQQRLVAAASEEDDEEDITDAHAAVLALLGKQKAARVAVVAPPQPLPLPWEEEAAFSLHEFFAKLKARLASGQRTALIQSEIPGFVKERYLENCKARHVKPNSLALSRIDTLSVSAGDDSFFDTAYDFGACHLGDRGLVCLLHALAHDERCFSVSFASCTLRRASSPSLSVFMEFHPRLRFMDLQQNNLSFDCGEIILEALQRRAASSRENSKVTTQGAGRYSMTTVVPQQPQLKVNLGGTPLAWDRAGFTVGPPAGSLWAGTGANRGRLAPSSYEKLRVALDGTQRVSYQRSDSRSPSPGRSANTSPANRRLGAGPKTEGHRTAQVLAAVARR